MQVDLCANYQPSLYVCALPPKLTATFSHFLQFLDIIMNSFCSWSLQQNFVSLSVCVSCFSQYQYSWGLSQNHKFWGNEQDEVVVYGSEILFHELKMAGSILV
jgi:hypothetical protein